MARDFKTSDQQPGKGLSVKVHDNNINRALSELRRKMANERWTADVKRHAFFVTKGERRRAAKKEAIRAARKKQRENDAVMDHNDIHHASAMKRGGTRRLRRQWDRGEGKFKKRNEDSGYRSYSDYTD